MALPSQWTWVWASPERRWWTGRPGVLQTMGSQRVGHDWASELNWTRGIPSNPVVRTPHSHWQEAWVLSLVREAASHTEWPKKKQNKINSLPSSREHGVTIRKEESVYYKLHLDIISALPIPPQSITSIKKPTRHTSFAEKNPRVCISENYPTDVTVILQMVYKPAGQYPCRQQGPWRANGYSHLITSRMWSLHLLVFCLDFRF